MTDQRSRRQRKLIKPKSQFSIILKKYRFELGALFLFSLGVFLLTEKMEIKSTIYSAVASFLRTIFNLISGTAELVGTVIREIETSDIVGFLLIFSSILVLGHRYRIHLWNDYGMKSECPKCEGSLYRSHRQLSQKILGLFLFLNVKNYKCKKCSKSYTVITQKR